MGIRHWIRKRLAEQGGDEEDVAPSGSIINAIFGREPPTLHALGEYDAKTYPGELQDLLRRREDVAEELREMDLTTRQSRIEAIPRLQQMLRTYPHPLAYETLIHAYVDAGRWDEARGAAFAARERRTQVSRSPYSEIRAEIDRLKEWTPEEVDLVRQEREGSTSPAAAPAPAARPVEPVRAPETAVAASSAAPVAVAEPDAAADVMVVDSADVVVLESAEATDTAVPADTADADDSAELAEDDGDPDDATEPDEPKGGVNAHSAPGNGTPRRNGKGGSRKKRRGGSRRGK